MLGMHKAQTEDTIQGVFRFRIAPAVLVAPSPNTALRARCMSVSTISFFRSVAIVFLLAFTMPSFDSVQRTASPLHSSDHCRGSHSTIIHGEVLTAKADRAALAHSSTCNTSAAPA